jgi:ABC-2 type transport system permease protein
MRAEWVKLTALRGIRWGLVALVATTVGLSLLIAGGTKAPPDPMEVLLSGVYFGQVAAAWLGVTAIGAEYATGMIATTFLATPRRARVLAGKAVVIGGLVLVVGLIAAFAAFLLGRPLLDAPFAVRPIVGSAVYMACVALLGLAVGTLVRGTNAAMSVVSAVLFLPTIAVSLLPADLGLQLARFCPMFAGLAIQRTVEQADSIPIAPGAGLALLGAYTAVALAAARVAIARA